MTGKEDLFYDNLKNQIIVQACQDYANAYLGRTIPDERCLRDYGDKKFRKFLERKEDERGHRIIQGTPEHTKLELEWFFHSDWFRELSGGMVDPDRLMKETIINAIDDIVWTINKAFSFDCHTQISLRIETPKGEENIGYPLPPLLADVCFNALRRKAKDLRKEAAELSKGHTPMANRRAL